MIANGRERIINAPDRMASGIEHEDFNPQNALPFIGVFAGLVAIFAVTIYACGWLSFQTAAGRLNLGQFSPGFETAAWLGMLFALFAGPIAYSCWLWFQSGSSRDAVIAGARFWPLSIVAVLLSLLPEHSDRGWLLSGWAAFFGTLAILVAVFCLISMLLKQYVKPNLEGLRDQVDSTVISIEGALANLSAEAQNKLDDLKRSANVARAALNRSERIYKHPFSGVAGMVMVFLIFASGIATYGLAVVPRLPKSMGGFAPTPMSLRLQEPKALIEGNFIASDDKSLIIVPQKVDGKDVKPGSVYRIPISRAEIIRTDYK